ncbi:MAG: SufE family protein [Alphaproteobacteria bacterium]|nr:SufE family protein [Alphaproteobacteria bacterium]
MQSTSIQELTENFALFSDWEERYRYLIDLGRNLPHMDESFKTDEYLVRGCTSQVWMVLSVDEEGCVHIAADSDAHIVRGLIAVLLAAYQDKKPEDIIALDIKSYFKEIGLDQHLSPNRRNGFFAMVERINHFAAGVSSSTVAGVSSLD